jgi:hypothetical protein
LQDFFKSCQKDLIKVIFQHFSSYLQKMAQQTVRLTLSTSKAVPNKAFAKLGSFNA